MMDKKGRSSLIQIQPQEMAQPQKSHEILINLKVNDNGKQIREEHCLIQHQGTVRQLVLEAQDKFLSEFKKECLKLRNVTIFSKRYGLEVSVDLDTIATEQPYTANFVLKKLLAEAESSSMSPNGSLAMGQLEKLMKETQEQIEEQQQQLATLKKEVIGTNEEKLLAEVKLSQVKKSIENQEKILKQAQGEENAINENVNTLKGEHKKIHDELKKMRDKIGKKEKEYTQQNDDIKKIEKKKEMMQKQMDGFKKELDNEIENLENLMKRKEKVLTECERLQEQKQMYVRALEDYRNDELNCKQRLEQYQKEEENFQLMLKDLREQEEQKRAAIMALTASMEEGQRNHVESPWAQQPDNQQVVVERTMSPRRSAIPTHNTANAKAFTVPCHYFNEGNCWRGSDAPRIPQKQNKYFRDKCTFIHDKNLRNQSRKRKNNDEYYHGSSKPDTESKVKHEASDEQQVKDRRLDNQTDREQPDLGQIFAGNYTDNENTNDVREDPFGGTHNQTPQIRSESWRPNQGGQRQENIGQFLRQQPKMQRPKPYFKYQHNYGKKPNQNFRYGNRMFNQYGQSRNRTGSNGFNANDGNLFGVVVDQDNGKRKAKSHSRPRGMSPIRNLDQMPSTSAAIYGNGSNPSILNRITIDEPQAASSSNIHSRLSFEE